MSHTVRIPPPRVRTLRILTSRIRTRNISPLNTFTDPVRTMPLSENELHHITSVTLDDYEKTAESFWRGTRDHDVSQNIDALLRHINAAPPFTLLDFGCGPGRDLLRLRELGHTPIGLDGTPSFVEMAKTLSGCEVWQQDFLQLDLPDNFFDGIYANATLFHIPSQDLPRVLKQFHATLKPGGVLFSS